MTHYAEVVHQVWKGVESACSCNGGVCALVPGVGDPAVCGRLSGECVVLAARGRGRVGRWGGRGEGSGAPALEMNILVVTTSTKHYHSCFTVPPT